MKPKPTEERFWKRVKKTETCWLWTGFLTAEGFGFFQVTSGRNGKKMSVHRYSYQLHFGVMPHGYIEHSCNNKSCVNPAHMFIRTEQERFWSFVEKTSSPTNCWIWIGALDEKMYGIFTTDHPKKVKAHRYSWELANKHTIKSSLLCVCHRCDHPYCVNPDHLFLGETQDNTQDRDQKGRAAKGEKNGMSNLTEDKVSVIRQSGLSNAELGKQLGVSRSTVYSVRKGLTWKHVP
jgi:hypothetical protein